MKRKIVIGTRGSVLALAQAKLITRLLKKSAGRSAGVEFETRVIKTEGDLQGKFSKLTGKEAFTGTIDRALVGGEIDIAVHSLKDVPVENFPKRKMVICAYPKRGSPFDVLVSKTKASSLDTLPAGSRVGTSSLRRALQLKSFRPDLEVVEVHGNVNTRIKKMRHGSGLDAIVLAEAGLDRLGLRNEIEQVLPTDIMLPAVGQGSLAVAIRYDSTALKKIVSRLDDLVSRTRADAERAFSRKLGGGCNLPIAALASVSNDGRAMRLEGLVAGEHEESNFVARDWVQGSLREAEALGETLAERLESMVS